MPEKLPALYLAACAVTLGAAPVPARSESTDTPPRIRVLDHATLERAVDEIRVAHPEEVSVLDVGVSRRGTRIDALRLARGPVAPGRPAILVVAALDAEFAWTSDLVLDHARTMLERATTDENARSFLESTTLYLVPRANPDAALRRTEAPLHESSATMLGVDDDRDGRNGEDGPLDVDGDGTIGWMRVLDPEGDWIEDPAEPRVLVKADAARGQRGRWKLQLEARDADGDGEVGEDPLDDGIVNRNFPQGWVEHAADSGRFPTAAPESRALADFVVRHPEIALVVTYGMLDAIAEKPKVKEEAGRRSANPSEGIPSTDADLYAELGRRWKALGGTNGKGQARDAGTFQAWVQAQRGLWTVNLTPWSVPLDEKAPEKTADASTPKPPESPADPKRSEEPKPSDDAKRLRWFDARPELAGFRPWTRIEHPDLAHVEVGGFAPFALYEPPPEPRGKIADATFAFLLELGRALPRVVVRAATSRALGADTWRVEAVIANESVLPLQSALARRARAVRPARVGLSLGDGATLVAGPREELLSELAGSGGSREFAWIVRSPFADRIEIVVDSDSAGSVRVVPEVVR